MADVRALATALARSILTSEQQAQLRAPPSTRDRVQRYLRIRRLRSEMIGTDLFADPAWDILLDLHLSQLRGIRVSVSSACIASGVPATTALRYINAICDEGLVDRVRDNQDSRRIWLQLTPTAKDRIDAVINMMFGDD